MGKLDPDHSISRLETKMAVYASDRPVQQAGENSWIQRYRAQHVTRGFDEVFEPSGTPRPAWRRALTPFNTLGEAELRKRWEEARALLHEHGVSYDVYGDPRGTARPWNLSPLPVVIDTEEWRLLSKALVQRAMVLDSILTDLYGAQDLLAKRLLPPELVFGNPTFARACSDLVRDKERRLPLYAADLGRREDGRFVVLADRTQAPSGAGYALENRIVLSRVLPEIYRECGIERLAGFFRTMRDTLRTLAPHNRDNPRIVLLTSGPYTETYFEQAFISQYLGLTLVQAEDLTVRNARVCLKTLGGLQPVDVVLRRLQDDACDPLEIRTDRSVGVPGFLEAARAGNVAVANPLGSAIVQSPAFIPFLPGICRALLGEDLAIESIPTYWCGDPAALSYVDQHLRALVVRPAYGGGQAPVFGRDLSSRGMDDLRSRIHACPRAHVAQEPVVLSTVPTIVDDDDGVGAGHLWMRAYLVASGGAYAVMPGGLSRVGSSGEHLSLALRPGGRSKDTWVLSSGPPDDFSLLPPPDAPAVLSRGGGDLQSRVADDLFWLGRYAERADGIARLARAVATRLSDQGTVSDSELPGDLDALLKALAGQTRGPILSCPEPGAAPGDTLRPPAIGKPGWMVAAEQALLSAVLEGDAVESLKVTVDSAYRIARMLRDRVSLDTWRTLVQLERDLRESRAVTGPSRVRALVVMLNDVITTLAAFSGLAMDSMSRGQAWRFLDMGRRLERATHMTVLLRGALISVWPREGPVLEAVLEVADSSMTYRRRYLASLQAAPVVDLLLMDETNPRSVMFQMAALIAHIDALPREEGVLRSAEQKDLGRPWVSRARTWMVPTPPPRDTRLRRRRSYPNQA